MELKAVVPAIYETINSSKNSRRYSCAKREFEPLVYVVEEIGKWSTSVSGESP